jgi:hypothetical protein
MRQLYSLFVTSAVLALSAVSCFSPTAMAQGIDTALLRGTVTDPTGGGIPRATVTMTNVATGVSDKRPTDVAGRYLFADLKPAAYTARVEAAGFKTLIRDNVVLRVGQETDLDLKLEVGQISQSVEVTAEAPLLNTVSGALGTEVSGQYMINMPLEGRDYSPLVFLAPGTTEVANSQSGGSGMALGGTGFASNGQRYATAEFRLDGGLETNPEGGEGGTTNLQYKPTVESIQEFKIQNNSFSAEYGSNGGTIVSLVMKSGTNEFHGSGYEFFRRPELDANNFFNNAAGQPIGPYAIDQYGGTIGGPIKKNKTFFFFDVEKDRNTSPGTATSSVPTSLQKQGNFSQTFNADGSLDVIFNPVNQSCVAQVCTRMPFPGNIIPPSMFDTIGKNLLNLYPDANTAGEPVTGLNNFTASYVYPNPAYQLDIKIDHNFSENNRVFARYSRAITTSYTPDDFYAPQVSYYHTNEGAVSDTWTISPKTVWTNRLNLHRFYNVFGVTPTVTPESLGFSKALYDNPWYETPNTLPDIAAIGYQGLVTDACCTTSLETDTQWSFSSIVDKIVGSHELRFGGERRIFLNNYFQPSDTNGGFEFNPAQTMQSNVTPNADQGNSLASMLLGVFDSNSGLGELPSVANKSNETSFFIQDNWRVTPRFTVNMGLRYEFSTPYEERYNREQFSCFTCDSGINIPALPAANFPGGEISGTTILASNSFRHADPAYHNIGPRLGFAYRLNDKTVMRAGAGIYYGMNFATNWQYGGTAWQYQLNFIPTLNNYVTQYATLENPFPTGFVEPEEGKYGPVTLWGESNGNHTSNTFTNGQVYQWNYGFQRELPGFWLLDINYSASHSVHLPWNYSTENRNVISTALREQYGTAGLYSNVPNPFQYLFVQLPGKPAPIINDPNSIYNFSTVPQIDLLRPYPQFPGAFSGFPLFVANSDYQSLQVRFEKRLSYGLSVTGNYTFSKFMDYSDAGGNAWIGNLGFAGAPQDLNNLRAEKSVSANDVPNRLAFAAIYELPVGRRRAFGNNMNRVLDAVVGGWQVNSFITFQSGNPLVFLTYTQTLADSGGEGAQRPDINGKACSGASIMSAVDGTSNYFNVANFSQPPDQTAGNIGRYINDCRDQGIANADLGLSKKVQITERKFIEVRGEFFNALNRPRFGLPNTIFGSPGFGVISSQYNAPRHGQMGFRFVF